MRSVPGWLAPEPFLLEKSERTREDEVPLASLNSVGKRRRCVAECAILFGPICARVILFSTLDIYCHSQKVMNNSVSRAASEELPFTNSESARA